LLVLLPESQAEQQQNRPKAEILADPTPSLPPDANPTEDSKILMRFNCFESPCKMHENVGAY
jgi:hypothetical protein